MTLRLLPIALFCAALASTASAQGAPSEADSLPASYCARPAAMATARFAATWKNVPAAFRRTWDSSHAADRAAIDALQGTVSASALERERMRLRFRHLWGRVVWPYFHWRESDAPRVVQDPQVARLLRGLPLADARWHSLPEHAELVGALVHERARALIAAEPPLTRGDARWLRAEFEAAGRLFADRALLRKVTTRLITTHLDDNDARGIDSVRARWIALGPDSASRYKVDSMIAVSSTLRDGHHIEPYKHVTGVPLELHVLRPTAGDTAGVRPAMLWFHGGSGTTGSWSHSPGVTRVLREHGVVVIAVEYRTGSRFDAGPVEQVDDAIAAYQYVRRHAARLGVDSARIGVSGFSSGAGLALTLATRGTSSVRPAPPAASRVYPAAVIVTGACTDPAGAREDGYFRKMVQRVGPPGDFSPLHLVAAGQPSALLVHATRDEYCAFEDAKLFAERSRALGNDVTLSAVEGATHFFGFFFRPGQAQMRTAIGEALARWGWLGR